MRQPYSLLLNAGFQHIFYFIDRSLKILSKKIIDWRFAPKLASNNFHRQING